MKSPELQQLTASEPLTLDQEYDMQKSWREDDDSEPPSVKLTQNGPKFQITVLKSTLQYGRVHLHHFG